MTRIIAQLPGEYGVRQTLSHMRTLVNTSLLEVRPLAARIISGCAPNDPCCQWQALRGYVRLRMPFVHDPSGLETLTSPKLIAAAIRAGRTPFGDCDDQSMFLAALGKSVGLSPKFRVTAHRRDRHGRAIWSHVFVVGNGYPLDTANGYPFDIRQAFGLSYTAYFDYDI